ncbi:MAG TPA: DNA polymerase III subunit alpha [Ignavibacteria bacterium]|nr:DNA polymerase III subunit alpha [Ignavibacteria bacterium]
MSEFIHLHNHTHYSLLDAICTVDGLVNAAAENKMNAVALTDHGVMYGAMEFYNKCRNKGVKPIIGFEAYVAQGSSRFDKGKKIETVGSTADIIDTENSDGLSVANINYAHLILLAKNEKGYRNLIKLNSIGHTEGFYYKPRIDLEVLEKYREGIVALSACAGGVISCYIVRGDMAKARQMTGIYKDIFGEDFYLEIQNHLTIEIEKKVLKAMPALAKEFGLKLIATNDVHYIKKEHAVAHNIYLHISSKQNRNGDTRDMVNDLRYGTDQIYFKTAKEMCALFKDFPEAIRSTLEVTEKCNLELDTKTNHMPNFPIPADSGADNLDDYLKKLANEGMRKRICDITSETEERLEYELGIIKKMDFSGYFLIVADFIQAAKDRGILVGPGRGSAAGSLVCYCMGITNVNPLDYNLLFERFLNPERISMPDIDIDFQDDRRDEVIQYAKEKYGDKSVAQIITFNKLAPRGVLKDVGRVLNFPFDEINKLTKFIPIVFGKVKPLADCIKEVPDFKNYFIAGNEAQKHERKKMFEYSTVLENLNKNSSIHASGVVIAPSDIIDYVPLSRARDPEKKNGDTDEEIVYCTQFDMNRLEDAGLIKMDFLGLKELKVIGKTLKIVNETHGLNLTTDNIPLDDKETYDLFSQGATVGIFQFSKSKMREYLSKLKPKNINDLAAMNALYRPGPMKLIPDFIDKRYGRKQITYLHPLMENALKDTYGIIVYQEQVMQIAREVAGFTMAQADNMRKAMGKKIKEKMQQIKTDFINGATKNEVPKKIAEQIFSLILDFADYGFNKSHGVAYSVLAYYTAYLKTHYPLEFLAVSMEGRKDDETELQYLADECKRMKIKLSPPDINESFAGFKVRYTNEKTKEGEIIYGLSAIKNVGEKAAENIIEEREKNGPFVRFDEFLTRVDLRLVNKKTVEALIFAGAFDCLHGNRRKLYLNLERAVLFASKIKDAPEMRGQHGLFGNTPTHNGISELRLEDYEEFHEVEKYNNEKAAVGFYLSGHPLDRYRRHIENFVNLSFGDDVNEVDPSDMNSARMCGVISDMQVKFSKKGNKFAVFNLIDFYGRGECVAFSKLYENKQRLFEDDMLVFVEGKAEDSGDKLKLIVENIHPIDHFQENLASNINLILPGGEDGCGKLKEIRVLAEKHPGTCLLYFSINDNGVMKRFVSKDIKVSASKELISNLKNILGEDNLLIN